MRNKPLTLSRRDFKCCWKEVWRLSMTTLTMFKKEFKLWKLIIYVSWVYIPVDKHPRLYYFHSWAKHSGFLVFAFKLQLEEKKNKEFWGELFVNWNASEKYFTMSPSLYKGSEYFDACLENLSWPFSSEWTVSKKLCSSAHEECLYSLPTNYPNFSVGFYSEHYLTDYDFKVLILSQTVDFLG